jgi:hypothetical protein
MPTAEQIERKNREQLEAGIGQLKAVLRKIAAQAGTIVEADLVAKLPDFLDGVEHYLLDAKKRLPKGKDWDSAVSLTNLLTSIFKDKFADFLVVAVDNIDNLPRGEIKSLQAEMFNKVMVDWIVAIETLGATDPIVKSGGELLKHEAAAASPPSRQKMRVIAAESTDESRVMGPELQRKVTELTEKTKKLLTDTEGALMTGLVPNLDLPYTDPAGKSGTSFFNYYDTVVAAEVAAFQANPDIKIVASMTQDDVPLKRIQADYKEIIDKNQDLAKYIFSQDVVRKSVETARAALALKATAFDGSINLSGELATLVAQLAALQGKVFPNTFSAEKARVTTEATTLIDKAKESEAIRLLEIRYPSLRDLRTALAGYTTIPADPETEAEKLEEFVRKVKAAAAALPPTPAEQTLIDGRLDIANKRIEEFFKVNEASGDEGEYHATVRKLKKMSDAELAELAITRKLKFETHTFEMNQPYDKALYEAVGGRLLLNWNDYLKRARKEGIPVQERQKWLATRALVATAFWCRKFCDSPEAPRSQVQNWKIVTDGENAFQLMSAKRQEMVFGALGHPVMGKFMRELLHQTMVQASLERGLVAYKETVGTDADGLSLEDGLPIWYICDAANVPPTAAPDILTFDSQFTYASIQNDFGTSLGDQLEKASVALQAKYSLTPEYLDMAKRIARNMFAGYNFLDVISAERQNRYNTPLPPRSPIVSSIELATNIFGGVIHGLTRYGLNLSIRKPHAWYLSVLGNPEGETDPAIKQREKSKFQFGQAGDIMAKGVQVMRSKVLAYFGFNFRTEVFERPGTTLAEEKAGATPVLGYIKPRGACRSHGMQNMFETFMPQKGDELPDLDSPMKSAFGFDNYLVALKGWGAFLDKFLLPVAAESLSDLKKSKIHGGVLATMIEDMLTFAKLVPGFHYDMVPIMLYDVVMRLTSGIKDEKERIEALEWCGEALKGAFNDKAGEESALKPIKPHAEKLLAMFDPHNPANTYHGMDPSFKPQDSESELKTYVNFLILKWKLENPHKPVPPIGANYTMPTWVRKQAEVMGMDEPTLEFYKELEGRMPKEPPFDRRSVEKGDE